MKLVSFDPQLSLRTVMTFKFQILLACEKYGEYKIIHVDEVFDTIERCKQKALKKLEEVDFPDYFGHPYFRILILGKEIKSFIYCPFDCGIEHVNFGDNG